MKVITTASEMQEFADQRKVENYSISFVPTMGALHNGHISLVDNAKRDNACVVVSVFVNPTQFNDVADLESYPRTFESDAEKLKAAGVDVMFFPSVNEVYPTSERNKYELDGLDERMEGPNRPNHFNGVIQAVARLFDMVKPDAAFFGEKDFQQLAIIRHMMQKLGYPTEILGCPTIREESGLAMSSRNARLTQEGLEIASVIHKALETLKCQVDQGGNWESARNAALSIMNKNEEIELEYLELVDPANLKLVSLVSEAGQACIAAWVEGVRLIDNMRVK
jgi:pantoate--beta-alanine ligase